MITPTQTIQYRAASFRVVYVLGSVLLFVSCFESLVGAEEYTCQADVFTTDSYVKKPIVYSPDRTRYIQLWTSSKDPEPDPDHALFYASIYSGGKRSRTLLLKNLYAATFVKWSPDSKSFYVMWSNGGAIGGYRARVFYWKGDDLMESSATKAVADDFARQHYCETRGNNLYVIKWLEGAKDVLLQPEVYPTSDCGRQAGFTLGYRVEVETGVIKDRYTVSQMKQLSDGCPSKVFPTAFMTQKDVDKTLGSH